MTRGERNNNPGNILRNGIMWRGMKATQTDPRFVQFISPLFGIRALARTLWAYQFAHGLKTVREIIDRWAPPEENNTSAYVVDVCARLEVNPDDEIHLENAVTLTRLCWAIIWHENGQCSYSNDIIAQAVHNALT